MKQLTLEQLIYNLPRHPGIMGKERFFNAAVLVPLIEIHEQLHFLFEKRADNIRQGGEISFPGGKFEPETDESCLEAALRETEEELGISREKISVLGRLDTFISPRGLTIDSFLAQLKIQDLNELRPDSTEVAEIFSAPVDWFLKNPPKVYRLKLEIKPSYQDPQGKTIELLPVEKLGLPARYSKPWPGLEHRVLIYQPLRPTKTVRPQSPSKTGHKGPEKNTLSQEECFHTVWGLTAELVNYLIEKWQDKRPLQK